MFLVVFLVVFLCLVHSNYMLVYFYVFFAFSVILSLVPYIFLHVTCLQHFQPQLLCHLHNVLLWFCWILVCTPFFLRNDFYDYIENQINQCRTELSPLVKPLWLSYCTGEFVVEPNMSVFLLSSSIIFRFSWVSCLDLAYLAQLLKTWLNDLVISLKHV